MLSITHWRVLSQIMIVSSSLAAVLTRIDRRAATCSASVAASCSSSSVSDTCCTNSPGGQILQTQFWDTKPVTGPADSWTIHGLWPDHCDGTYDAKCDSKRQYTNITAILKAGGASDTLTYMNTFWVSDSGSAESFWEHEWGNHGTCISTLDPKCYGSTYKGQEEVVDYFDTTVSLFKSLPTYTWLSDAGIVPSSSKTYTLAQLQAVATANHGQQAIWNCRSGVLNEVWWHFHTKGSVSSGSFIAAATVGSASTCPSTGIKYLPKSGSGTVTASTGTPTSTGPPTGSNHIKVITSSKGSQTGCLISAGTWYVGGTCATYTITNVSGGITLKTSKGVCSFSSGTLNCAGGNSATVFTSSGGVVAFNGQTTFYGNAVPSGSTQVSVTTAQNNQAIQLVIS